MSIETSQTDKALGGILEAIQAVTPEMAAQAVAYWRFVDTVWVGILGMIALIASVGCVWCLRKWAKEDFYSGSDYTPFTWIFGIVAVIFLLIGAGVASDLAKTYIAPDYYSADCIVELGRKALD